MSKNPLKEKVRKLRARGKTYSEIQEILKTKVPKSTLSYWCKNVRLPDFYTSKIEKLNMSNLDKARALALVANRKKRLAYLDKLQTRNIHLLNKLDIPTQKLILSILYLAEGAKHKSSRFLMLGSSNPKIIRFYLTLLKNCYKISNYKFRVRIQCRYDQNMPGLEKFWHKITGISLKQFYPTYADKRTKGKKTNKKGYMGVCAVHYFDTEIQLELELLADAIMSYIEGR